MARQIYGFDDGSIRKLRADHERLKAQFRNLFTEFRRMRDKDYARDFRFGKTTTSENDPTYPGGTANTFVVQYQDWTWDEATGANDVTRTDWQYKYVFARAPDGVYVPEDTPVTIQKFASRRGRKWHIMDAPHIYKAVAAATLSAGGSGNCTLYVNGAATSVTLTVYNNWLHGGEAIDSGTGLWIIWRADEADGAGRWVVLEPECTPRSGS